MLTVSIVIPCKNDARMLARCLNALSEQLRPGDEVIVVDNGSTDDSEEVARAAGARVIVAGGGLANATASGFDAATGDVLARIDADTVPPPGWLERLRDDVACTPAPVALTGPADFYGSTRFIAWTGRFLYLGFYFHVVGAALGRPPLFGSNMALTAPLWARIRGLVHRDRVALHDDLDISLQLPPDAHVRYDHELRVGVSARQLTSWRSLARHVAWAGVTFAVNGRQLALLGKLSAKRRRRTRPTGIR